VVSFEEFEDVAFERDGRNGSNEDGNGRKRHMVGPPR